MEAENIPPHISANEHRLRALEEQLLRDGKQWLKRAVDLYTATPKLKIWVPVLGSVLLTSYYMYAIHARAAAAAAPAAANPPTVIPESAAPTTSDAPKAVAVAEDPSTPQAVVSSAMVSGSGEAENSDSSWLDQAQQAHDNRRFAEEAADLQKVFDHSHAPQQVCPAIGKAYERAGQIDASIHAFEKCTAASPQNVDLLISFAHALQAKPDFIRAAAVYRQALQKDPANLDAQTGIALVDLKQNHLPEARQAALSVLRKSPDDTDALLVTGIVAWRESKLPEAEKIFEHGVELDARRADFHAFLGRIAEAERRPQDALQQYEQALSLDPADAETAERRTHLKDTR